MKRAQVAERLNVRWFRMKIKRSRNWHYHNDDMAQVYTALQNRGYGVSMLEASELWDDFSGHWDASFLIYSEEVFEAFLEWVDSTHDVEWVD